jgi:hypothetical protein
MRLLEPNTYTRECLGCEITIWIENHFHIHPDPVHRQREPGVSWNQLLLRYLSLTFTSYRVQVELSAYSNDNHQAYRCLAQPLLQD